MKLLEWYCRPRHVNPRIQDIYDIDDIFDGE